MPMIAREAGRNAFGADPALYARGRPNYPARVFELLAERCGLGPSTRMFELGPGTGQATRALLDRGVGHITAIEPDRRLADFLAMDPAGVGRLEVVAESFETVPLAPDDFDLGIAATAFHWVDAAPALAKVVRSLRPGGWWAAWWTIFTDPFAPDALRDATASLFAGLETTRGFGDGTQLPFGLDRDARIAELRDAGLVGIEHERIAWSLSLDAEGVVALYATFSQVARLAEPDRERFCDDLRRIVEERFGGTVERRFLTPIYIGSRRTTGR